jgi:hypothetical protein
VHHVTAQPATPPVVVFTKHRTHLTILVRADVAGAPPVGAGDGAFTPNHVTAEWTRHGRGKLRCSHVIVGGVDTRGGHRSAHYWRNQRRGFVDMPSWIRTFITDAAPPDAVEAARPAPGSPS